jgi:hypothetical protein
LSNHLDEIGLQILLAKLRGIDEVEIREGKVVDGSGAVVFQIKNDLRYVQTRVKTLASSMGVDYRSLLAQAVQLEQDGRLKLNSDKDAPLDESKPTATDGSDWDATVCQWQLNIQSRIAATSTEVKSDAWMKGIGHLIARIATDLLPGGRVATVDPIPGLPTCNVSSIWVDSDILPLRTRDEAFAQGSTGFDTSDDDRRQPASLFMDGFSGCAGIFGAPGAGKSTLLKWIASEVVRSRFSGLSLPLFIPLRHFAEERRERRLSLFQFAFEWHGVRTNASELGDSLFDYCMSQSPNGYVHGRNLLFLLDGWDEVTFLLRKEILADVQQVMAACSCLVTSRPSEIHSLPINTLVRVEPLSPGAMWRLINNWLSAIDSRLLVEHLTRHPRLEMFSKNAFVLTALCGAIASRLTDSSESLPRNLPELYDAVVRAIQRHLSESHHTILDDGHLSICARLAYHMLAELTHSPTYEFGAEDLTDCGASPELLERIVAPSRLVVRADPDSMKYSFLHPTMHEYLASRYLERDGNIELLNERVRHHLHSPLWSEVLRHVAAATLNNASASQQLATSLRGLIQAGDDYGVLTVRVAEFLAEARVTDGGEALVGQDVRQSLWDLVRKWPKYRAAMTILARLDYSFLCERWEESVAQSEAYLAENGSIDGTASVSEEFTSQMKEQVIRVRAIAAANTALREWAGEEQETPDFSRMQPKRRRGSIISRLHEVEKLLAGDSPSDQSVGRSETEGEALRLGDRARCGDTSAIRSLRDNYWRSNSQDVQLAALIQLGATHHREARDALLGVLAVHFGETQDGSAALDQLTYRPCGDGEALLAEVLADPNASKAIRSQAVFGLDSARDSRVSEKIAAVAFSPGESRDLRLACIGALSSIGDVRHLQSLINLICEQSFPGSDAHSLDAVYWIMKRVSSRTAFPEAYVELEKVTEILLSRSEEHHRIYGIRFLRFLGLDRLKKFFAETAWDELSQAVRGEIEDSAVSLESRAAILEYLKFSGRSLLKSESVYAILQADATLLGELDLKHLESAIARWSQETGTLVFDGEVVLPDEPIRNLDAGDTEDNLDQQFAGLALFNETESKWRELDSAARESAIREAIPVISRVFQSAGIEFDQDRFFEQKEVGQLTEVYVLRHILKHADKFRKFAAASNETMEKADWSTQKKLFGPNALLSMNSKCVTSSRDLVGT